MIPIVVNVQDVKMNIVSLVLVLGLTSALPVKPTTTWILQFVLLVEMANILQLVQPLA